MRIVFFGTSDFALPAINALSLSSHKILAVVTAADKRKGRGRKISLSAVKALTQEKRLPLLQPQDLNERAFVHFLKNTGADLFVVAAYGKILSKKILQIPRVYAINLHASLLPKYRGAAPINWALIRAEKETGVTIFKMNEYMDKGEIILQQKTAISFSDTAFSLRDRLANIAAGALLQALDLIEAGKAGLRPQDERLRSFAPKLKKEDGLINWHNRALEIYNRIRALQPWPGAFTYLDDKLLKIWQSKIIEGKKDRPAGEVVSVDKTGILVQTGREQLLLTSLQLEGKRKMSAAEFILGHKVEIGKNLGK
jgi:methionyl-tRNA formyltransferase